MNIHGVVVDEAVHPLNATVSILETGQSQPTGSGGAFRFDNLRPDVYFLTARADGFHSKTLSVTPEAAAADSLRFVLEAMPTNVPYNTTVHFRGHIECALETLILSPSCDSLLTDPSVHQHAVFSTNSSTLLLVDNNWKTVVTDVVFDPGTQPALDGLRITVRGSHNVSSLGAYQQYGRFNASHPFTFRIEPGATYPDGTGGPVPENTTVFKFDVYPQSKEWHKVCEVPPVGSECFLGVGAGKDVQFDLYMTVFYVQKAPDGFTVRK
jgi:hypothetical protein